MLGVVQGPMTQVEYAAFLAIKHSLVQAGIPEGVAAEKAKSSIYSARPKDDNVTVLPQQDALGRIGAWVKSNWPWLVAVGGVGVALRARSSLPRLANPFRRRSRRKRR